KKTKLIHVPAVYSGSQACQYLAGLIRKQVTQTGVGHIRNLRIIAGSDGAMIIASKLQRVPPDIASVLFRNLHKGSAGVIDLAIGSAPSKIGKNIGNSPPVRVAFGCLQRIFQTEELVGAILDGPVVAEARFR